jgi:hypothetical protein
MSAPMRIQSRLLQSTDAANGEEFRSYLDRLMKMIPGEVVGLYLVGHGIIPSGRIVFLIVWILVCFLGVVAVKAYGTSDASKQIRPDWTHAIISSIAFLIWVYSMGDAAFGHFWDRSIASLLVLAWTFFIPIFYKGPTT